VIRHSDIRRAEYIIETSDIVQRLEGGINRSNRGRKANVGHLRLLMIGMFLSIHHGRSATITDIHETLTVALPLDEQFRLGIRRNTHLGIKTITYRHLDYQANRLRNGLAYGPGSGAGVDDLETHRRHDVVMAATNGLMDVFNLGWHSPILAIDATGIWSWGKGGRKTAPVTNDCPEDLEERIAELLRQAQDTGIIPDELAVRVEQLRQAEAAEERDDRSNSPGPEGASAEGGKTTPPLLPAGRNSSHDPDAAWGVKTAKSGKSEIFYGYHEHTLVHVPPEGTDEPPIIRRLELTPASVDVVDVSLRLLDSLDSHPSLLLADMHYSYKKPERWLLPLIKRGIRQIADLRSDQQGFTEYERMRFAAGHAHCPSTPDGLGVIPKPGPFAPETTWQYFHSEIERRHQFTLRVVNQLDQTGAIRCECPSVAGKVGCPLRPGTVEVALQLGLPIIEHPPTTADGEPLPDCCTQGTVLVRPPEQILKTIQPFYWGSRKWRRHYRRRTYVEGSYGNRKNPSTENMRRGMFRSVGVTWANLVIAMAAASYNTRMIRNWHDRTGLQADHPLLAPDDPDYGFMYLTPDEAATFLEAVTGPSCTA
jgi:hypothetical protein